MFEQGRTARVSADGPPSFTSVLSPIDSTSESPVEYAVGGTELTDENREFIAQLLAEDAMRAATALTRRAASGEVWADSCPQTGTFVSASGQVFMSGDTRRTSSRGSTSAAAAPLRRSGPARIAGTPGDAQPGSGCLGDPGRRPCGRKAANW